MQLWQYFSFPLKVETLLAFRFFHTSFTFSQNYQILQHLFFLCFSIELNYDLLDHVLCMSSQSYFTSK